MLLIQTELVRVDQNWYRIGSGLFYILIKIFTLQLQNNFTALAYRFFELFISFALLFLCCELADQISSEFEGFHGRVDAMNWYLLPLKVQKLLPLIMQYSQQPVEYECLGCLISNRDTFKKVSLHFLDETDYEISKEPNEKIRVFNSLNWIG